MGRIHREPLEQAQVSRTLIRVHRTIADWKVSGYVLDTGPKFVLLALVNDDIWLGGYEAIRLEEIAKLEIPDPYAGFVERALKLRNEVVPEKPPVSADSLRELLLSAGESFPLVTIYRELEDPDVCHIGQVEEVDDDLLVLREIAPDATWEEERGNYLLDEITRVDFGGGYEEALALVAGLV